MDKQTDDMWVADAIAQAPELVVPPAVAARLDAVLAAEHQRRSDGITVRETAAAFDELGKQSDLGRFGPNPPSHYDRHGLGLSENHETTEAHRIG